MSAPMYYYQSALRANANLISSKIQRRVQENIRKIQKKVLLSSTLINPIAFRWSSSGYTAFIITFRKRFFRNCVVLTIFIPSELLFKKRDVRRLFE